MQTIGEHNGQKVIWLDFHELSESLSIDNWLCLMCCNKKPDEGLFDKFARVSINNGILEFKGHGAYSSKLNDFFDWTMVVMETMENHSDIDIMTTWHDKESLDDALWQCFYATCLPAHVDKKSVTVVCTDIDGENRVEELKYYLAKINEGWSPSD